MAKTTNDRWILRGQKPPDYLRGLGRLGGVEGWGCWDVNRFGDGSGFSGHSEMTDWNGIGWSTGGADLTDEGDGSSKLQPPPRHAWRYKCTIRG